MKGIHFDNLDYSKLHWQSDWNGDEVGFENRSIVGLYTYGDINFYIDTETEEVLEIWFDTE
ncbi:hypothetical protein Alsa1_CDS0199 [Staphylococcus phage Alsa_1]|nr:hypothetical protein Alsa1_CDS0199 [Staphylococcus phage Alsa_1]